MKFLNTGAVTGDWSITGNMNLNSTTDANQLTGNKPPLIIGDPAAQHLRIDNNELISITRDVSTTLPAGNSDLGGFGITASSWGVSANTSTITGLASGSVNFTVKGASGQTADLIQAVSSSGAVLFNVKSDGTISGANLQDTGVVTTSNIFSSVSTGWTIGWQQARVFGPLVAVTFSATYSGATVTVPANGDITNQSVGTLATAYRPFYYFTLQNFAGPMAQFYVNSGGAITLSAVAPGSTLVSGTNYQAAGVWMTA